MKHIVIISRSKPELCDAGLKETAPQVPSITGLIDLLTAFFDFFIVLLRFKTESQQTS